MTNLPPELRAFLPVHSVEAVEAVLQAVAYRPVRPLHRGTELIVDAQCPRNPEFGQPDLAALAGRGRLDRGTTAGRLRRGIDRGFGRQIGGLLRRRIGRRFRRRIGGRLRRGVARGFGLDVVVEHERGAWVGFARHAQDREQGDREHQEQARRTNVAPAPAGEILTGEEPGVEQQVEQRARKAAVERDIASGGLAQERTDGRQRKCRLLPAIGAVVARCSRAAVAAARCRRHGVRVVHRSEDVVAARKDTERPATRREQRVLAREHVLQRRTGEIRQRMLVYC